MEWYDQVIDEALRKSAASLEENYPADLLPAPALWTAINAKRKRNLVGQIQRWSAAASIVVLATALTIWVVTKKETGVPVSQYKSQPAPMPATENEAMAYIKQVCMGDNIVCRSPVFKELQSELDSSSTALTAINQQLTLFGNDEQLVRAKTRIENHQARIVKAMLQIL